MERRNSKEVGREKNNNFVLSLEIRSYLSTNSGHNFKKSTKKQNTEISSKGINEIIISATDHIVTKMQLSVFKIN